MKHPSVTVTALVTAPCEALFALVSDPTRHPEMAGSGEVMEVEWLTPPPVGVGSGFQARQCVGWYQYPSRSYVQVYEPPYRFIWLSGPGFKKPPIGQLWGFDLKPLDARTTLVSHLMKWPLLPVPEAPPFSWIVERGLKHEVNNMRPTLYKLARLVHAEIIGEIEVTYDWCESTSPCGERRRAFVQA